MGLLDDVMKLDSVLAFTDAGTFGEPVTVVFADGTTRSINATIDRHPPEVTEFNGVRPRMTCFVANHATLGILWTELDAGGIRIRVAYRPGDTAADFQIADDAEKLADGITLSLY